MPGETYKIRRIVLVNMSSYLIFRPGEAILVDCGNSGSEVRILETMDKLGLEPEMLRLLVLTHSHFDHAGSTARLKELSGCKVMIHRSEAERLRLGQTPIPSGTRWKAKLLVGMGRIFARRLMFYKGADADLLVEKEFDLEAFGFPGRVIHTPGHTFGYMVVMMEGGELIGGDTVFGLVNKQHFPPFAEDLPALVRSWDKIRQLPVKTLYPAHGRPFSRLSFMREFDAAMKKYS